MKITNLSANELELREGSASGLIVGAALILGGLGAGFYLRGVNPYMIWIAAAMLAIGVGVAAFASSIRVNANKQTGKLSYQKKRLVGTQDSSFAIADVFRIETRKQWQMQNTTNGDGNENTQQPVLVAQSVIVFKDGRELALDHQKNSSTTQIGSAVLMSGQGAETALAAQVAKFLNVPFQEIAPPNMGSGINIIGV